MIDAQLKKDYEFSSSFRDIFSSIMRPPSSKQEKCNILKVSWLDSPLGPILAIADEEILYLLEYVETRGLEREIERLRKKMKSTITPGVTPPIRSIVSELKHYFKGTLKEFKTPFHVVGSPFQKRVWEELQKIPYGQTRSYMEIAAAIGRPTAYRAVAQANSTNQLAIVIPCHRVINANGELGGYAGGLARKQWMLKHEKSHE